MFPPYREVFFHNAPLLFFSILVLLVARGTRRRGPFVKVVIPSASNWQWIVPVIIGCGFIVVVGTNFLSAWQARVAPDAVTALEFRRLDRERGVPGEARVITDAAQIAHAFKLLAKARTRPTNHESFSDGYVIRIALRSSAARSTTSAAGYLRVFRKTSLGDPVNVVITPSLLRSEGLSMVEGDAHSAPEFHAWLGNAVDPLFTKPSVRDHDGAPR